jgi:hypothetical protein
MKLSLLLCLLVIVIPLSACAPQSRPVSSNKIEADPSAEAEPIASRETLFVYGGKKTASSRLVLELSGEPVLLSSGYLRLVGVVAGARPMACLELGGRGFILTKGEVIDDYRVAGLSGDTAVLERKN